MLYVIIKELSFVVSYCCSDFHYEDKLTMTIVLLEPNIRNNWSHKLFPFCWTKQKVGSTGNSNTGSEAEFSQNMILLKITKKHIGKKPAQALCSGVG